MRGLRPELDIPIVYTGVRPGEKLHEELLFQEEGRETTNHPLVHRLKMITMASSNGDLRNDIDGLLALSSNDSQGALTEEVMRLARGSNGRHARLGAFAGERLAAASD
jgi:FlaA1/EpsC-like NDP-sugar epimerase